MSDGEATMKDTTDTYQRLERDVTAVKNDIAALTDQITDALNTFANFTGYRNLGEVDRRGNGAYFWSNDVFNQFSFPGAGEFGTSGRNTFRGPRYFSTDMSLVKQIPLTGLLHLGEAAHFEVRANFFNIFNQLNLTPFSFGSPSVTITDANFGKATTGLAGRVVEFQGRIRF